MKFTAIISGKVQGAGYRARVADITNSFGLRSLVENLMVGWMKIIAEDKDEKIKWFKRAIDIKNASRTEFGPTILLRKIFIVFYQVNAAQEVILQICRMLYLRLVWMTF